MTTGHMSSCTCTECVTARANPQMGIEDEPLPVPVIGGRALNPKEQKILFRRIADHAVGQGVDVMSLATAMLDAPGAPVYATSEEREAAHAELVARLAESSAEPAPLTLTSDEPESAQQYHARLAARDSMLRLGYQELAYGQWWRAVEEGQRLQDELTAAFVAGVAWAKTESQSQG